MLQANSAVRRSFSSGKLATSPPPASRSRALGVHGPALVRFRGTLGCPAQCANADPVKRGTRRRCLGSGKARAQAVRRNAADGTRYLGPCLALGRDSFCRKAHAIGEVVNNVSMALPLYFIEPDIVGILVLHLYTSAPMVSEACRPDPTAELQNLDGFVRLYHYLS